MTNSVHPQQLMGPLLSSASVKLRLPGSASCAADFLERSAFGKWEGFFYNHIIFRHSSVDLNSLFNLW